MRIHDQAIVWTVNELKRRRRLSPRLWAGCFPVQEPLYGRNKETEMIKYTHRWWATRLEGQLVVALVVVVVMTVLFLCGIRWRG